MTTCRGSCHCGAVTFRIEGGITCSCACNCSLCKKKNALMAKVPEDRLSPTSGADSLSFYQWNTRVAKDDFCKHCGIYPVHRNRSELTGNGVNLHCLDGFEPSPFPTRPAKGDGSACSGGARERGGGHSTRALSGRGPGGGPAA